MTTTEDDDAPHDADDLSELHQVLIRLVFELTSAADRAVKNTTTKGDRQGVLATRLGLEAIALMFRVGSDAMNFFAERAHALQTEHEAGAR